jgi:hypothetical protein
MGRGSDASTSTVKPARYSTKQKHKGFSAWQLVSLQQLLLPLLLCCRSGTAAKHDQAHTNLLPDNQLPQPYSLADNILLKTRTPW